MKNVKGKLKSLMALVLSFTILSGTVVTPAETLEPREIGEDTILSEEFQQQLEELAQTPQITSSEDEITAYSTAPSISVTLKVGSSIKYNSYSTKDYSLSDGTKAFCLEPKQKSPAAGGYTASRSNNQLLNAMMYYGYGGPGYEEPGKGMIYMLNDAALPYGYVLTHMALSYIYDGCSDSSDAFTGTNQGTIDGLKGIVATIDTYKWDVPSRYQAYTFSTGSGNQAMGFGYYEPEGYAKIKKSSANASITDDNSCYSLEGAVYGVYDSDACTNEVGTLTTDANGDSNTTNLYPGTYWVKEKSAPKGYALDTSVHQISVADGQTTTVEVSEEPLNDPVVITLQKVDKDTGETAQGMASLEGAQFTIRYYDGYYDKTNLPDAPARTWIIETKKYVTSSGEIKYRTILNQDHKIAGDNFYLTSDGRVVLPLGTITIEETKAPNGYQLDGAYLQVAGSDEKIEGLYVAQINQEGDIARLTGGNIFTMSDSAIYGGVSIQKYDYDTKTATPQGEASLQGAEIEIINESTGPVAVNGTTYQSGDTVLTLTTDESGIAQTALDALPYGDYRWRETKAPFGYLLSGVLEGTFSVRENGVMVELTASDNGAQDKVIRGGVKLQKYDLETNLTTPQGEATLQGAKYAIINMSKNAVYVQNTLYAPGQTVMTLTSDKNGFVTTALDDLPCGDYKIVETKAPDGYLLSGVLEQSFSIRENGVIVDLTAVQNGIRDQVIRGGVKVQKRDYETGDNHPMGGATLEGAEYNIINKSKNPVIVNGKSYANGKVVMTLTSDKDGFVSTAADALPRGDYTLVETKAPAGYLLSGVLSQDFSITENGVIVDLTPVSKAVKDKVKRGDFEVRKIDSETQKSMDGVEFSLTNLSTGETHNFTTDENGYYSSASSWNKHSYNTNKGGAEDGMWFGQTTGGKTAAVNDDLGALPYGIYSMDEIEGINNAGKEMFHGLLYIRRDSVTVDLGNIENYGQEPPISMDTVARDAASDNWYAVPDSSNQIIDTVSLEGLVPGREYTLKGVLMEKETKTPLLMDDEEVTAEKTFTAENVNQTIEMTFQFDGSQLAGKEVVVFESIYYRGEEKASHESTKDADQTVYFPILHTSMQDADTASHNALASKDMKFIDHVTYEGLRPGVECEMKGILMDAATGEALLIDGEPVTSEVTFIPSEESGEVEMTFSFDGSKLGGTSLVAYESCLVNGVEIAVHQDIDDAEQTVQIPKIHTELTDTKAGTHLAQAEKKITLTDKVTYENLIPGREYVMKGILMDAATCKSLTIAKEEVTAEITFTPEEKNGSVELTFTFDADKLAGKTLVAYETCYMGEAEVAVHKDLKDSNQTVQLPKLATELTDDTSGTHMAEASDSIMLTDKVAYENLIPDREYVMKGVLMDKDTGKELVIDGKKVTAEKSFTPKKSSGTLNLTFTLDGSKLAGKTLVAFEKCYLAKQEIAAHEDLGDVKQTVQLPDIGTTLSDKETGSHTAKAQEITTLVDRVAYENLIPGKKYMMQGILMDAATGEALLIDGEPVTSELTFTPEKASGVVELTFSFDASLLSGESVVAFETCSQDGKVLAIHHDIKDENQTVHFPVIKTELTDSVSGFHISDADKEMQLTDTVSYENLVPGEEYVMKGILMNQETKEPLLIDGEEVTAEQNFIPESADGTVDVTFSFDAQKAAGQTVVAYESCTYGENEIAFHKEIDDKEQTVWIPAIATVLIDSATGAHQVQSSDKMEFIDTVSYENLIPGREYVMKGILMDKTTKEALKIDGKEVTAECTFTPEKTSGQVEMHFSFAGNELTNQTLVAFETCFYADSRIAGHEDIEDENQSIVVTVPPEVVPEQPKTGDKTPLAVIAGVLLLGSAFVVYAMKRRNKKTDR